MWDVAFWKSNGVGWATGLPQAFMEVLQRFKLLNWGTLSAIRAANENATSADVLPLHDVKTISCGGLM